MAEVPRFFIGFLAVNQGTATQNRQALSDQAGTLGQRHEPSIMTCWGNIASS